MRQVKTIHPSAYKYAAGITMLQTFLGYLLRGQFCRPGLELTYGVNRRQDKSIAEEAILQVAYVSILL